jgi:hypothetical protein
MPLSSSGHPDECNRDFTPTIAAAFEQHIRGVSRGFRTRLFASRCTEGEMAQTLGSCALVARHDGFIWNGFVGVAS